MNAGSRANLLQPSYRFSTGICGRCKPDVRVFTKRERFLQSGAHKLLPTEENAPRFTRPDINALSERLEL